MVTFLPELVAGAQVIEERTGVPTPSLLSFLPDVIGNPLEQFAIDIGSKGAIFGTAAAIKRTSGIVSDAFAQRAQTGRGPASVALQANLAAQRAELNIPRPPSTALTANVIAQSAGTLAPGVIAGGQQMGFLSGLIKTVTGIGRGILGLGAKAPAAVAQVVRRAPVRAAAIAAGAGLAGGALAFGGGGVDEEGNPLPFTGGGGNGRFVTMTLVQTVDRATNQVVRQRVEKGSPFLMNRDIAVAKRVARTANKLGRKFSRKSREPSQSKLLMDAIQQQALSKVLQGAACPS